MRLAQIEQGTVVNAVEADPGNAPDWADGWPELTGEADIGWTWDGSAFAAPVPPPPTHTRRVPAGPGQPRHLPQQDLPAPTASHPHRR